MQVNIDNIISVTEANQNFSKLTRMVDENGAVVILKNNKPKYVLLDYGKIEKTESAEDSLVEDIAMNFLTEHMKAFKELAK